MHRQVRGNRSAARMETTTHQKIIICFEISIHLLQVLAAIQADSLHSLESLPFFSSSDIEIQLQNKCSPLPLHSQEDINAPEGSLSAGNFIFQTLLSPLHALFVGWEVFLSCKIWNRRTGTAFCISHSNEAGSHPILLMISPAFHFFSPVRFTINEASLSLSLSVRI